jgi:putative NADH-flavin reductase
MKLAIIAATGGVGQQLLRQALDAGHDVTAVVRNPAKIPADLRQARIVAVDLANPDPAVLEAAIAGTDAVVSGLGPPSSSAAVAGITTNGTRAVAAAMHATGVKRLVVVSAAPVGTVPSPGNPTPPKHDPGDGFIMRHLGAPFARTAFGKTYTDLAAMEDLLRDSDLDWTVVRPPRLTNKPLTGHYRTATGQNVRGGVFAPRADVAHLMLAVLGQPGTIRQVIGIAS